jgi:hypothetical protein
MCAKTILITRDADDEYRVPSKDGREAGAYYTNDKEDALATAKAIWGQVNFRIKKVESHPEGR